MSTRYIVYGAGAVGGVVGARLHEAGHDVALIARGAHLDAIRRDGLTLQTPVQRETFRIPAAGDPAELSVGGSDDVVLLAVKSQDTIGALASLRAAGAADVPIVCLQNGVANERACLRWFADVYGAVVMAPTAHLRPGQAEAHGANASGIIDIGRVPDGTDARCDEICAALSASRFQALPSADVMRRKYAKLVLNLTNAVGALFGDPAPRREQLSERLRAEGRVVLDAAGIDHSDDVVADVDGRFKALGVRQSGRVAGTGSSTWQSLERRAGTIETDYLNGEIVLLGRLHGVPTPLNEAICRVAADAVARGIGPGELSIDETLRAVCV